MWKYPNHFYTTRIHKRYSVFIYATYIDLKKKNFKDSNSITCMSTSIVFMAYGVTFFKKNPQNI